ncbi:class I SAM-dependent methyltransferase [Amylibacter sp.]|nr:class I SAM-dependent methyltransferase [Amylibacter sp.]
MTDNSNFEQYGDYYDLFNSDKDYKSEANSVNEIISQHGDSVNTILEFGSGTGRHAVILADHFNYKIQGVEQSHEMIKRAAKAKNFNLSYGDIRDINFYKKFDAVISLFHVLSYQIDDSSIEKVFFNAFSHLKEGGVFICDFWYTPSVLTIQPEKRIKRIETDRLFLKRTATPTVYKSTNTVNVEYNIDVKCKNKTFNKNFIESHNLRHFTISELDSFANKVGFKRVGAQELMTGKKPSKKTWAVCTAYVK